MCEGQGRAFCAGVRGPGQRIPPASPESEDRRARISAGLIRPQWGTKMLKGKSWQIQAVFMNLFLYLTLNHKLRN